MSYKLYCKMGHEFTEENTIWQTGGQKRRCRTCHNSRRPDVTRYREQRAKWKAENKYKEFGLTLEQATDLKAKGCEICGTIEERMTIDHDHKSGKFRGALCVRCNLVLGHINDDIDIVMNILQYLIKHEHLM